MLYRYTGIRKELVKRTCQIIEIKQGGWASIKFLDTGEETFVPRKTLRKVAIDQLKENKVEIARFRIGR